MLKKISIATVLTFAVVAKASAFGFLAGILALAGVGAVGVPIGMAVEAKTHTMQDNYDAFNAFGDADNATKAINQWCKNVEPNNFDKCAAAKKEQLQKFTDQWNTVGSYDPFANPHGATQAQPATQPAK
jgi:hypothetical protein